MTDNKEERSELARRGGLAGGKARAEKLSPERKSEIAKAAADRRWLYAKYNGVLEIGDAKLPCHVLSDGRRVLSRGQAIAAFGMKWGTNPVHGADRLANFAAGKLIKPYVSEDLGVLIQNPIQFRIGQETQAFGIDATAFSALCEAIVEADRAGALQTQQKHIANQAWKLMKGFSRVGLIALVDEATGYQYDRARDELQTILKAYISDELLPWMQRFPHEFYKQAFRLHGWEYREGSVKGPAYMGKFINRTIYDRLPPGVHDELRQRNPAIEGKRRHKHHQFLTEMTGVQHLDRQIIEVTALMKASKDRGQFDRLFETAFPKPGQQLRMPLTEGDADEN